MNGFQSEFPRPEVWRVEQLLFRENTAKCTAYTLMSRNSGNVKKRP